MLAKIESRAIYGISAYNIDVEVDISSGIPCFSIVGMPDTACRESSKRVLAALKNSGYKLPSLKITVNLAPAYIKKEGSMYDLAIAVGILTALDKIDKKAVENKVICGELSLDGGIRPIKGALPIADSIKGRIEKELIIPLKNLFEVVEMEGVRVVAPSTLTELIKYLAEGLMPEIPHDAVKIKTAAKADNRLDYSDIKGNSNVKRALEIAIAGGHNILLIGPPGVGKTMMAKRIPTIMEELTKDESIETSKIYSVCGLLNKNSELIKMPPFRMLHHSVSDAATLGGGSNNNLRPGEISLAHNGILFLDELPEFRRDVLEALRQPLEEGIIRVSRVNMSVAYPAKFMLVAAMNPCPCGFLTHPEKNCTCTAPQVQKYLSKVSGPLLDRIDMHIEVLPIKYEQIRQIEKGENSEAIQSRVKKARQIQFKRFHEYNFRLNAHMEHHFLDEICQLTEEAEELLKKAVSELFMSVRAHDKVLKIARTIADLEEKPIIDAEDISEAIGYRCLDTRSWLF